MSTLRLTLTLLLTSLLTLNPLYLLYISLMSTLSTIKYIKELNKKKNIYKDFDVIVADFVDRHQNN